MNERMLELAKRLVEIPSVNSTDGERAIGVFLEETLRAMPYFQAHPEQVIVRELKGDPLKRRNVMALLIGEKNRRADTLLLHGHTDTVGVEDYGALQEVACKPEQLMERLRRMALPEEVRRDLDSGEYLFGRGACDMKSGDAVFVGLLEELSAHPEKLSGNLLVSLNPVEENLHTGIIESLDILLELKERYGLEYKLAINNDYICPLFPGDRVKTVYTGVVGKLLPCFYLQGKETHVGQCFEGFDASLAAAKLVERVSLNCDFCDGYQGEYTLPPSVLKLKDLKPWYNVQTAQEALVYFNYFVHNAGMGEITEKLLDAADWAMRETLATVNRQAGRFGALSGQRQGEYRHPYRVLSYRQLCQELLQSGALSQGELDALVEDIVAREEALGTDKREIPVAVIRALLERTGRKEPAAVLYFAAPYCPHNTLQGEDAHCIGELEQITEAVARRTGERFRVMKFFPSLSDSSYLKIDDDAASIRLLTDNFPAMGRLYPVPVETIQRLNIPAVNYGCYGKDAHKWTERVHLPYTFRVLPELLWETLRFYQFVEEE